MGESAKKAPRRVILTGGPGAGKTTLLHRSVFILPPWAAIYENDSERDQSFADAVNVHVNLVSWYRSCGYVLHEVPRLPVPQRARHVLRIVTESHEGPAGGL